MVTVACCSQGGLLIRAGQFPVKAAGPIGHNRGQFVVSEVDADAWAEFYAAHQNGPLIPRAIYQIGA